MAKKGMKRPDRTHTQPRNQLDPVPELQGKAKQSKAKAGPDLNGIGEAGQAHFHRGNPIPSDVYPVIDTDLARDNVENDLTAADRQDL